MGFVRKRFVIPKGVQFPSARQRDRAGGHPRIFAVWIRVLRFRDLLVKILRLVLAIDIFEAARFEVFRRKRQRRLLRFRNGFMKQRQRACKIFLGEKDLRDAIGGGPREFAVAIIIEDALETGARRGALVQRPITFREIKVSARTPRGARELAQEFFIFRRGEIVNFPGEQSVRIIQLPAVRGVGLCRRAFRVGRARLRRSGGLRRTASRLGRGRRGVKRHRFRRRRFIDRLGPANFRSFLLRNHKRKRRPKNQRDLHEANRAPPRFHFAVAKATFVTPASLQMFSTPTMFL